MKGGAGLLCEHVVEDYKDDEEDADQGAYAR